jgi:hypothetical protein
MVFSLPVQLWKLICLMYIFANTHQTYENSNFQIDLNKECRYQMLSKYSVQMFWNSFIRCELKIYPIFSGKTMLDFYRSYFLLTCFDRLAIRLLIIALSSSICFCCSFIASRSSGVILL